MKRNAIVQYYVEGEDEKRLLNVLKTDLRVIQPGKIDVFNVVCDTLSLGRLMALKPNTVVVLVFDTDAFDDAILKKNIESLKMCSNVEDVLTIPQARNLEEELVKSCNIKDIKELLNSKSKKDFKTDLIKTTNLTAKLIQKGFDINKLWIGNDFGIFTNLENRSREIKR
jgi:hypothetical protein